MAESAYDRLISALRAHGCKVVDARGGRKAESTCPHHEDRNPSVSITGTSDGVLAYCHAGCDIDDVLDALGLTKADLFDERSATYRYDDGRTVKRFYDDRGKKRFVQTGAGATSTLYHLAQLQRTPPGRTVFLVEGEKDVHAIEAAGGVATTAPQGADSFHKVDVTPLAGHRITVVVDRDAAGDKWAAQVYAKLNGVVEERPTFVYAKDGKDAADHIAAGHGLNAWVDYEPPTASIEAVSRPQYGDVAALLAGGIPEPPQPEVLFRVDGHALLYSGKVNVLFGDSESGKTWIGLAALVEVLTSGGKAAVIDLDHNGMAETVSRMILLGAKPADLSDPNRFRYCEPQDAEELDYFVADIAAWKPWAVIVDSLGEVLPMLGLNSNSPDEYTAGNRRVLTPLANAGAACIAIDHLPKDDGAREKGQTGTLAKKRSINGISLRVTVKEQFTPGQGGSASLTIAKDRPGGLRGHCPAGKNAPAGRFVMTDNGDGTLSWQITEPRVEAVESAPDDDVATLDSLAPAPRSQRDVKERLGWSSDRAMIALRTWRDLRQSRYGPSRR
jgi:5S rRNA maturation endonuclease (ribonuclease M5)